jgi:formylglycine-generating enzyme required for sulfatase activity
VRELYSALKTEGWIDPWLDKAKILPGQDWRLVIEKAVEDADVVIVCLSNQSVTKEGFVQREIKYSYDIALEKPEETIFLIPLRLDNCVVPRGLRSFHWVDYFGAEKKDSYSDLLEALKLRYDQKLNLDADDIARKQFEKQAQWEADEFARKLSSEQAASEKMRYAKMEQEAALAKVNREAKDRIEREVAVKKKVKREARQRKQREFISSNSRWFGVGGIMLLFLIFGGFGLNYLFKNPPVATVTASPTNTATPKPPTSTKVPFMPTSLPSKTPSPTPTLGIDSTQVSEKDGMISLYVPEGEFTMGDANIGVYQIYLSAFWIDQTEVTNEMYTKCVDVGKCDPPSKTDHFSNSSYANHPVVYVDWNMANAYCSWAGRRLPTEVEWEKAASWDDQTKTKFTFPWGESIDCSFANFVGLRTGVGWFDKQECIGETTNVKSYSAGISPYGAYDMAGNVWEWVSSLYKPYPYDANDGREDMSSADDRVLRGGAWGGSWTYNDSQVRSSLRDRLNATYVSDDVGFRCARSLP